MTRIRTVRIPLLRNAVGETALAKVFCSNMGDTEYIRVSAEERSCLEGVYTVRRSETLAGDKSEMKM